MMSKSAFCIFASPLANNNHAVLYFSIFSVEALVQYEYEAGEDDELSLAVGDVISNVVKQDGGWWEGELNGKRGVFPDNFVKVLSVTLELHSPTILFVIISGNMNLSVSCHCWLSFLVNLKLFLSEKK